VSYAGFAPVSFRSLVDPPRSVDQERTATDDLPLASWDNFCVNPASKSDLYRKLPSVDEFVRGAPLQAAIARDGRAAVTAAARAVLERARLEIGRGGLDQDAIDILVSGLADAVERELRTSIGYSLRPVINATGVILHTNLGRAPLARSAIENIAHTAAGYSNLEFDLDSGERGERDVHVDRLFRQLFQEGPGSISTIVVNNNAAAVWLALNTLAAGGEVIVSRGELVEIGGSFRIPDVMQQSNAILREVGTTNRTRIGDYEQAICDKTRVLLRVHRSNFEITGFTEQPALEELVGLARARDIPLVEDLGSGAILELRSVGIAGETGVGESLRTGVDVVTYSGDKLLGGPQAGMLTGRADLIRRMRRNSLFRALRVDKLTYAALEATLLAYVKGEHDTIPAVYMMRLSKEAIEARATRVSGHLQSSGIKLEAIDGESLIGGGAAPSATLPTRLLTVTVNGLSAEQLQVRLRALELPIIARVQEGRVVLDLRTVPAEQDDALVRGLKEAAGTVRD
jgi:L-seryl-tRNA(Ser) seleniumtransferase